MLSCIQKYLKIFLISFVALLFYEEIQIMGIAETFKALSDPQRRELLNTLKQGRKNAGELAELLNVSPQTLSYHLRLLKNAELVLEYKEKNYIYYELNTSIFEEIMLWAGQFASQNDT